MLGTLFLALALIAFGAWAVAVSAAVRIAGMAPAGRRLDTWFSLGWWRFAKVRELAGDAAIPYIKRYIQAFLAFFAAVISGIVVAALVAIAAQNGGSAASQAAVHNLNSNPSSLES